MPARIQLVGAVACLVIATSLLFVPASAQEDTPPSPTPTPNRAPSYERGAPPGALQLQGPPPSISQVILDDSLQGRGAIPSRWECMTGRNVGEFVGEGYIVKVTGPCGP
ncbi:MAG: hypothetical protein ACKVVP_09060, partial [Chloroflexota bacterium]